ncbi:hypothetical protein [Larkinella rosea]|uniref:Lipoprotein n=1 Tax=Larkinella rosea TaxID=2025312 RepID=A0A3P1BU45_9BACT|nr:hypothetical protein [Larkinella rosea]RRB04386.1 hypothetical protein EHT25_12855 [Larkinella rosea]
MKKILSGTLFFLTLMSGCQMNPSIAPDPVTVCPPPAVVLSRDSIATGSYLGLTINEEAENVYAGLQALRQTKGVTFLNVVSNVTSDLTQLRERLPLYQYILLDQNQGTDSGVQITLEFDQVKSIYLNSGKQLSQWPTNLKAESSIRLGDAAGSLYAKFVNIRAVGAYANKFERIFLMTKNLAAAYDPAMRQSPQWYFTYTPNSGLMDEVQVHFQDGKVRYISVIHYKMD